MNMPAIKSPDPALICMLNQILEQVIAGEKVQLPQKHLPQCSDAGLNQLINNTLTLARQYNECRSFIQDLARGKLDTAPPIRNLFSNPFKGLHSELLHLTWQIQEISKGDYEQKVSFCGNFSLAINSMIQTLKEKERLDQLNRENEQKLQQYADELQYLNDQLRALSVTDALTGVFNRRQFDMQMAYELQRCQRSGRKLSLIMFDIDHFKQFNDRHGHQAGDQVLVVISQLAKEIIRTTDLLFRYGGEEFTIILPETDLCGALLLTDKLRQQIEQTKVEYEGHFLAGITASFGVAGYTPLMREPAHLLHAVDEALYFAKNSGRNCIRIFEQHLPYKK